MIRSTLLALSRSPTARERLPRLPFVRRSVNRFMPGESMEAAVEAAASMGRAGIGSVFTMLGEDVNSREEARSVVDDYQALLDHMGGAGVDAELSVKPTQLGLTLGEDVAAEYLSAVARATAAAGVPLWLDMEGSPTVDPTLRLYRRLLEEHPGTGLCLQAYLHRTPADLEGLLPLNPRIRLVKGAYAEPPSLAIAEKSGVDAAYARLTRTLLEAAAEGRAGVVLGTHDMELVALARREAAALQVSPELWAIHMLYGIRTGEQRRLQEEGVPLRVLISYGPAWFPWYMRRLAERPANVWFVVKSLFG
jgi:proline dehydrogenase